MQQTTITLEGIEFDVDFNYTPEEKPVYRDSNGEGHPGSPSEVEILSIEHKGTDFTNFLVDDHKEIERIILDKYEQD